MRLLVLVLFLCRAFASPAITSAPSLDALSESLLSKAVYVTHVRVAVDSSILPSPVFSLRLLAEELSKNALSRPHAFRLDGTPTLLRRVVVFDVAPLLPRHFASTRSLDEAFDSFAASSHVGDASATIYVSRSGQKGNVSTSRRWALATLDAPAASAAASTIASLVSALMPASARTVRSPLAVRVIHFDDAFSKDDFPLPLPANITYDSVSDCIVCAAALASRDAPTIALRLTRAYPYDVVIVPNQSRAIALPSGAPVVAADFASAAAALVGVSAPSESVFAADAVVRAAAAAALVPSLDDVGSAIDHLRWFGDSILDIVPARAQEALATQLGAFEATVDRVAGCMSMHLHDGCPLEAAASSEQAARLVAAVGAMVDEVIVACK